jgi:hypothetical protein
MVWAGVLIDVRAPYCERTVTTAPPVALVESLVQMCGTELTSDVVTAEVVSVARSRVPPLPAKVPSQAAVCGPILKVMIGSTEAEILKTSSFMIYTWTEPLSLVQVIV